MNWSAQCLWEERGEADRQHDGRGAAAYPGGQLSDQPGDERQFGGQAGEVDRADGLDVPVAERAREGEHAVADSSEHDRPGVAVHRPDWQAGCPGQDVQDHHGQGAGDRGQQQRGAGRAAQQQPDQRSLGRGQAKEERAVNPPLVQVLRDDGEVQQCRDHRGHSHQPTSYALGNSLNGDDRSGPFCLSSSCLIQDAAVGAAAAGVVAAVVVLAPEVAVDAIITAWVEAATSVSRLASRRLRTPAPEADPRVHFGHQGSDYVFLSRRNR